MTIHNALKWSIAAVFALGVGATPHAQEASVQKLYEAGQFDQVVETVNGRREGDTGENAYFAAQAYLKTARPAEANAEFDRLKGSDNEGWKLIGESGALSVAGDGGAAIEAARNATAAADDNPYTHYQLGVAAFKAEDYATASAAFMRAIELKGDLAYAHYFVAQAFQKQRQPGQASEHFQTFLRLAPEAPERQVVQAVMRTLRG